MTFPGDPSFTLLRFVERVARVTIGMGRILSSDHLAGRAKIVGDGR